MVLRPIGKRENLLGLFGRHFLRDPRSKASREAAAGVYPVPGEGFLARSFCRRLVLAEH
jgi:hypothetical protein